MLKADGIRSMVGASLSHHPCVSSIFFVGGLIDYCKQPIWVVMDKRQGWWVVPCE